MAPSWSGQKGAIRSCIRNLLKLITQKTEASLLSCWYICPLKGYFPIQTKQVLRATLCAQ